MADLAQLVEQIKGLSLMEASELVKMLEEELGVSAAAPVAAMAMPGMVAAAEEEEEQTVLEAASTYELSADGTKILAASRGQWGIVNVAPGQRMENQLPTHELEMVLEPEEP